MIHDQHVKLLARFDDADCCREIFIGEQWLALWAVSPENERSRAMLESLPGDQLGINRGVPARPAMDDLLAHETEPAVGRQRRKFTVSEAL